MKQILAALFFVFAPAIATQLTPGQISPSLTPQPAPPFPSVLVSLTPDQTAAIKNNRMTSLFLSPAQVERIVRAQSQDVLRYVLVQKCAGACGPVIPPNPNPVPTSPPPVQNFTVGVMTKLPPPDGVIAGNVRPGVAKVEIDFDGSAVQGVFFSAPASVGNFLGQIDPRFHDGAQHCGVAKADGAKFDAVDGNGNTFCFVWPQTPAAAAPAKLPAKP